MWPAHKIISMMTKHHKWDLCKHCSLSVLTLLTNIMVFRPMVFRPMVFRPMVFRPMVFRPMVFRPMVFTTGTFHSLLCFIQTLHIFKMGTWVKHRNILLPKIIMVLRMNICICFIAHFYHHVRYVLVRVDKYQYHTFCHVQFI